LLRCQRNDGSTYFKDGRMVTDGEKYVSFR
jgi:hypothetical protein